MIKFIIYIYIYIWDLMLVLYFVQFGKTPTPFTVKLDLNTLNDLGPLPPFPLES